MNLQMAYMLSIPPAMTTCLYPDIMLRDPNYMVIMYVPVREHHI